MNVENKVKTKAKSFTRLLNGVPRETGTNEKVPRFIERTMHQVQSTPAKFQSC